MQALTIRGIKELVMYPISVVLIFFVARVIAGIPELQRRKTGNAKPEPEQEAETT